MRILAVDSGEKRLGIAVSDLTGTLARPLTVLNHISREENARRIIHLAEEQEAGLILIGQSFDDEGSLTPQGRKSERLAEVLRSLSSIPVVLWDESFSTQDARAARREMGVSRRKRGGHLDDVAASMILQSYLDQNTHHE
jgi:putative Holliday junction resolvase